MNTPKDEKLAELGKQFTTLQFSTPLSADSSTRLPALTQRHRENKMRNVRRVPATYNSYLLQFYIGASIRTIASFMKTGDYISIARLADMITHTVGRYRLRVLHEPAADEYNFTPAQAEADCNTEQQMTGVIKQIEAHLREIGALCDSEKREAKLERDLTARINGMERRLAEIEKRFGIKHET